MEFMGRNRGHSIDWFTPSFQINDKQSASTQRIYLLYQQYGAFSQQPYWCSKTIKRQSYWGTKPILWKLISFLMLTLSFVPINLHGCCSREWKRFMVQQYRLEALREGLSSALSWPLRVESLLTFPAVSISSTFNGHPSTSISVS